MNELKPCPFEAKAEALAAWNRRAQPEPAASADPSRDAYEGCREDLLDWKRRALKAEETCRQLTRALGEDVNGTTFMGEPVLPPRDAAPSVAPEPVEMRPYNPTEAMRWAAKRIDPALPHEHIRALWCVMWSAYAHPPRAPLTEEQAQAMWTAATIEECSHENCYLRGLRDAEHAHGIGGK